MSAILRKSQYNSFNSSVKRRSRISDRVQRFHNSRATNILKDLPRRFSVWYLRPLGLPQRSSLTASNRDIGNIP